MANIQQIKAPKAITRRLSIAAGLLAFGAFIIQGLGSTWGFEGIGQQIAQTALIVNGGINMFFLGSTTQKEIEEKEDEEKQN